MKVLVFDIETSIGQGVHGSDPKDPENDYYTVIYGDHPDNVKIRHNFDGFKRRLPEKFFDGVDIVIGHNLSFDLGYIWQTSCFQAYIKRGGKVWDTQLTEYFLSAHRHQYASLAELQEKYLGKKIKQDCISRLFKNGFGADKILAAKDRCKRLYAIYERYCVEDGETTLRIFARQYKKAQQNGMLKLIQVHQASLLAIINMQCEGIVIDAQRCEETLREFRMKSMEFLEKATELVKPLWDERLGTFNINSPKQKSAILFGGEFIIKKKVEDGFFKNGNPKFKFVDEKVYIKGFDLPKTLTNEGKNKGVYTTDAGTILQIYRKAKNETAKEYCRLQKEAMTYHKLASTYLEPFLTLSVDSKLYPNFNTCATVTGRLSSRNPNFQNCVTADTEVLTPRGWVFFPDLLESDQVYQVDPHTFRGEFVTPSRIVCNLVDENLISIKADWGEFIYTSGHRVIHYNRKAQGPAITSAADWLDKWGNTETIIDRKVLRSSYKSGGRVLTSEERLQLELAIIVQAEGSKENSGKYVIRFRGPRKISQILQRQDELGLIMHEELSGRWSSGVSIEHSKIAEWLDDSKAKNFLPSILGLSLPDLQFFYATLHLWDGDYTMGNAYGQKASSRRKSLEIVQAVASMIGISTSYYTHPSKDFETINFHTSPVRHQSRTTVTEIPYSGNVYCVTVPTGAFMIRRNGAVLVTGNCPSSGPLAESVGSCLIAPEGFECVDIDFSSLEIYVVAMLAQDKQMIADLISGVDFHVKRLSWIPRLSKGKSYDELMHLIKVVEDKEYCGYRKKAKGVSFAKAYGGGAKSLAEANELEVEDVQALFDAEDQVYYRVKEFNDRLFEQLKEREQLSYERDFSHSTRKGKKFKAGIELLPFYNGDIAEYHKDEFRHYGTYKSPLGHVWAFEELGQLTRNGYRRRYSTTETKNFHVQGTAADIMQTATSKVFEYVLQHQDDIKLVRQIHDSLGFYVKKSKRDLHIPKLSSIISDIRKYLKDIFGYESNLDYKVEAKTGKNFANLEVYHV